MIKIKYNIGSKSHTKDFSSYEELGRWIVKMHGLIEIIDLDTNLNHINPIVIELRNIDLTGISILDQIYKVKEEEMEFMIAIELAEKENAIEEFFDDIQSKLGLLEKLFGIKADEVMERYPKHLEKIKNRPRKVV